MYATPRRFNGQRKVTPDQPSSKQKKKERGTNETKGQIKKSNRTRDERARQKGQKCGRWSIERTGTQRSSQGGQEQRKDKGQCEVQGKRTDARLLDRSEMQMLGNEALAELQRGIRASLARE
ncbi:uncharacterized protein UBRO_20289 [Ustilago bromivora]|uniref:Uncharacterized protein n=1 Tax=Ustilago bromivora TaxID=307758 RepID=A0A1K0HCQ3_9BASI|nr:uncharacterized protein UBRO_20289 [Ustilago bromivora]